MLVTEIVQSLTAWLATHTYAVVFVVALIDAAAKTFETLGAIVEPVEPIFDADPVEIWNAEFYASIGTRLAPILESKRDLLDPAVAGAVIDTWRRMPTLDYISTAMPRCVPRGMDAEIVNIATLRRIGETAVDHHRVHVTSGVYTAPDEHRMVGLRIHPDSSDLRVTLDTVDDWDVIADRMGKVPEALAGYTASLGSAAARGDIAARRQVEAAQVQCGENAAFFARLVSGAGELPSALLSALGAAAASAASPFCVPHHTSHLSAV